MKWIKPLCTAMLATALAVPAAATVSTEIKTPKLMEGKRPVPSALLMNAYRYMGKLKRFSIDAVTTSDDNYMDRMVVTYTHWVHMDVQRPSKLHIGVSGDLKAKEYYINGKHFTVYDALTNYYGTLEIPEGIDKALDFLFEKYDVKSPLANILYSDLYRRIPPKDKGYYFGISEVEDTPCHHIGFVTPTQEYQVWIASGERPVIRKFVIIDKTEPFFPRSGTVLRWHFDEKASENLFRFDMPKGAVKIDIEPIGEWEEQ